MTKKPKPTFEVTYDNEVVTLSLRIERYESNRRIAVELFLCNEQGQETDAFSRLSINTDDWIAEDEFVLNHDAEPEFVADLESRGLIERTGRLVDYGYVRGQPVCRLTKRALELDRNRS